MGIIVNGVKDMASDLANMEGPYDLITAKNSYKSSIGSGSDKFRTNSTHNLC